MSTACTIIAIALMLPVCTLIGVWVGHKLTIKSQPTNENPKPWRRSSIDDALSNGGARRDCAD